MNSKRSIAVCLVISIAASAAAQEDTGLAATLKDEIFELLENCTSSHTESEIESDPDAQLSLSCLNACIETKLNAWLRQAPENKLRYFDVTNIYGLEAEAGLRTCRESGTKRSQTRCLAQFAPDIVVKLGRPSCVFHMECFAKFDIDDSGNPTNAIATCPEGVAKTEFEREVLCLLGEQKYPFQRGRESVRQPYIFKQPGCPIS